MATRSAPDNHNSKIMLLIISSWELGYVIYVTAVTGNKRISNGEAQHCILMSQERIDKVKIHRVLNYN